MHNKRAGSLIGQHSQIYNKRKPGEEDLTELFSFLYIAAKLQELYGSLSSTRSM